MPAKWTEVNLIGVEGEKEKQGKKKKKRENRKKEIIERKEK